MEVSSVPDGWLDTEQYMDAARQPVPDNQEILVEPLPDGDVLIKPSILFVDLHEMVDAPDVQHATWRHVEDILERMGTPSPCDTSPARVASFPPPGAVARDDREAAAATVEIELGAAQVLTAYVVRVPRARVDIVLSAVLRTGSGAPVLDLAGVCSSLAVIDWGLFVT
ncbi:hypothetical protein KFE25_002085 [Diacronema lutheri]|uniref:Uncharacterized protein n=1 Tax=Diacronema lutheri TaxID=2081491 RepID=A0A8J6CB93_DIALT|nr:hypothetical protein KFE25_002085 [Diacronema lutheri]